jgi:hypothetical protein
LPLLVLIFYPVALLPAHWLVSLAALLLPWELREPPLQWLADLATLPPLARFHLPLFRLLLR